MAATFESVLGIAKTLSKVDQQRLARRLMHEADGARPKERVSILELKGLGKELWEGVDTDAYIRAERDSWDR